MTALPFLTPAEEIRLDALADRFETPCGDGVIIWRRWGAGPPLVLFHGAHGSWAHWTRNIPHYAQRYTVWAPDLPGFGESALPDDPRTGEGSARPLAEGLRFLLGGQAPLTIAGFSYGGVIASWVAAVDPALVRRLILIDVGGLGTPLQPLQFASHRGLEDPSAIAAAHRHNLALLMFANPERIDDLAHHLQIKNVPRGRINPRPISMPAGTVDALVRSSVPVDAIWGDQDAPHPDPDAQRAALLALRPDLEFRVVEDAGHWSMYEQPERFHQALDALLAIPR